MDHLPNRPQIQGIAASFHLERMIHTGHWPLLAQKGFALQVVLKDSRWAQILPIDCCGRCIPIFWFRHFGRPSILHYAALVRTCLKRAVLPLHWIQKNLHLKSPPCSWQSFWLVHLKKIPPSPHLGDCLAGLGDRRAHEGQSFPPTHPAALQQWKYADWLRLLFVGILSRNHFFCPQLMRLFPPSWYFQNKNNPAP